jgi:hypothetical protein
MELRAVLVALIVMATAAFVVGTAIERNSGDEGSAEGEAAHAESGTEPKGTASSEELKPLGIDVEAPPFVALAAGVSLLLAIGAWLRPRWLALLLGIVAAMVVFAALDVREIFHQSDESRTGLAVLAALVAALRLGAAAVAALLSRQARRPIA